jgi:biopolymer transport protein ExbD
MFNKAALLKYFYQKDKKFKEIKEHTADTSSIGDMAFLLLVFFIVTGSFMLRQGVFFSLPSNSSTNQVTRLF